MTSVAEDPITESAAAVSSGAADISGGARLARYSLDIRHSRKTPVAHAFRYRSPLWLFDADHVPALPRGLGFIAAFDIRDHWWRRTASFRAGVNAFLAAEGRPAPARVLVLTGARSFGLCFNPLTVYWCYDGAGRQTDVIAEVHNTYQGRHAYLLQLDDAGRDTVDKHFYVSPFFAAEGRYRMRISPPAASLHVSIALEIGDRVPFVATMRGDRINTSRWALLTRPLAQVRVTALIKWQGIRLWLRKVPVQPRAGSAAAEAATAGNLTGSPTIREFE